MGTEKQDEIYTNYSTDEKFLRYSKEGNTTGRNNVKSINDMIKRLNKNADQESE